MSLMMHCIISFTVDYKVINDTLHGVINDTLHIFMMLCISLQIQFEKTVKLEEISCQYSKNANKR